MLPWLVWLSGLSAGLQTKGSPVRFPGWALAWVTGQVPWWECVRGNPSMFWAKKPVTMFWPNVLVFTHNETELQNKLSELPTII